MDLQITGTNIKITDPVRKYIERKLGKLNKHWPNIMEIKAEIAEQQTKSPSSRFLVRVTVDSGHGGVVFHAEERAEEQLKAIDKVSDVLVRQLENHKGKKHDKTSRTVAAKEEVISERLAAPPSGKKVVKVKNFLIKLQQQVKKCWDRELTKEEALSEIDMGIYRNWSNQERLAFAVGQLYKEFKNAG